MNSAFLRINANRKELGAVRSSDAQKDERRTVAHERLNDARRRSSP
jgi:hypothetical protein